MKMRGSQVFGDQLARFAAGCADARVSAIAERATAPLRVVVRGRAGVGRDSVAHALAPGSGITLIAAGGDADLVVQVVAEVVKPEDSAAIAAAGVPVLTVLNKADLIGPLSGHAGEGPLAAARARCAHLTRVAGVPVEPISALLAVAALRGLDAASWDALRTLAAHPACLRGSFEEFLAADNPVPRHQRLRLLDTLDLFGTALGIAAVHRGGTPMQVQNLLRRVSGVDAVLARLSDLGAQVRYRRVLRAGAELEALAVGDTPLGRLISGFLTRDDTVIARMAAAVDVADAAGLDVTGGDEHLARAVRWQRYRRGSASDLHRACGADITRGSLRLWSQAGGAS
jgi:hypothetical protein